LFKLKHFSIAILGDDDGSTAKEAALVMTSLPRSAMGGSAMGGGFAISAENRSMRDEVTVHGDKLRDLAAKTEELQVQIQALTG
jgi:hypothetical protein